MSDWKDVAHFMYGKGFWYADPLKEIQGLTEKQLFWVPDANNLCVLWQVGHIAHRERVHIGKFLQGEEGPVIPPEFEVFNTDWHSARAIEKSISSIEGVLDWVREVRQRSHAYIASLDDAAFLTVPPTSAEGLSVAHWLFITAAHTALHIGRIQFLRAMIERKHERAC